MDLSGEGILGRIVYVELYVYVFMCIVFLECLQLLKGACDP